MLTKLAKFCLYIVLVVHFTSPVLAGEVKGVRLWQDPEKTRVVIDLTNAPKYQTKTLQNPYRLFVDIEKADLNLDLTKVNLPGDLVKKVRAGKQKDGDLRLVLDLKNDVTWKHFTLEPHQNYGHRLVIDLRDKNSKKTVVKTAKSAIKNENRDIIIAIDAGHGGEDPGAVGKRGTLEKNVNLEVAKRLARLIDKEPGFKAFLTRTSDYYVGLEKRTKLARKNKADLFISLHADGFTDPRVKGASVWTLSRRGANTEMGKWLEQREKSSDLLGGVESLQNKDPLVAQVLLDLSMHYSVGESLKAAEKVRGELSKKMDKMHGKGIRKAAFIVLRMPDIPAMLVEMAFISNPTEEKRLRTSAEQNKIAKAVFTGVKRYFRNNPPEGTRIAALSKSRSYKVKSGDTLSEIAQNFGVSTKRLKSHNKLKSNSLRIGQTLSIPGA
ncbi:N-acetylmuramoyl-L-alanine amidase [Aliikangiella marina]|uniref:N-acetylmuramoyl-L-alanine amidase n=1 Tax=Aliikangiella marina TaxID=1712262 RepID=UPI00163DD16A|nr:N-acetylmuramoyl-L-alanine amidase [Aliikangiella marina]